MSRYPCTRMTVIANAVWVLLLCTQYGAASDQLTETIDGISEPQLRRKRYDDVDPLEFVVAQLSQKVSSLDAQLQATKTELQATKTELQATKTELQATKTELQATNAELQATNAELQATNAELQATNAELQATKTELQATNAELQATNAELQATKTELQATNAELQATNAELQATNAELQATKTELQTTNTELHETKTQLQTTKTQLQTTEAELQATKTELQNSKGSTFVSWGRTHCPASAVTIYSGVVGGEYYNQEGASNRLCLSMNPVFDNTLVYDTWPSHLYGAEYFNIKHSLEEQDVVCAVCRTIHHTTIMIPGTSVCPSGWTFQYSGHLTGGHGADGASEYLCLDGHPEFRNNPRDDDGALFHYTIAVCGSLPCPPYINNKVVTCVICSK